MVCIPLNPTSSIYLLWVPLIIFECMLLALAVFRGLQTLNNSGSLGRKLVLIFMRDSVVYFLAWVDRSFLSSSASLNRLAESAWHMPHVWESGFRNRYVYPKGLRYCLNLFVDRHFLAFPLSSPLRCHVFLVTGWFWTLEPRIKCLLPALSRNQFLQSDFDNGCRRRCDLKLFLHLNK